MVLLSKIGVLLWMIRREQLKDKSAKTHAHHGTYILMKICLNWDQLRIRMKRKCMYINKYYINK